VAQRVNEKYYKQALVHVLLYHACLNDHGFEKLAALHRNSPSRPAAPDSEGASWEKFCESQGAEVIPEICNEFVVQFCKERKHLPLMPSRKQLIEMTTHMCAWLHSQELTENRLRLIKRRK